ncbi:MAG TPA: hypothetical protein VEY30_00315 [Myxococcaceae bacterium]|nr:hypothetical protein [Myxococcaceae bacterium]
METQENRTQQNGSSNHSSEGFSQRIDQIGSTAQQLWSEARGAYTDLRGTLDVQGRMERHPYAMLAGALGVGYVLGGGLFSSFTFRLVRLGLRAAAIPVLRHQLMGFAESALGGAGAERSQPQGSA